MMACWSTKSATIVAGSLGIFESLLCLTGNIYFILLYYSPNMFLELYPISTFVLLKDTYLISSGVTTILIIAAVFNILWLASSVSGIVGNMFKNVSLLKFWLFMTLSVIVTDLAFSIYFLVQTSGTFEQMTGVNMVNQTFSSSSNGTTETFAPLKEPSFRQFTSYLFLTLTISRIGFIGVIGNMFLLIIIYSRIKAIIKNKQKNVFLDQGTGSRPDNTESQRNTSFTKQMNDHIVSSQSSAYTNQAYRPQIIPRINTPKDDAYVDEYKPVESNFTFQRPTLIDSNRNENKTYDDRERYKSNELSYPETDRRSISPMNLYPKPLSRTPSMKNEINIPSNDLRQRQYYTSPRTQPMAEKLKPPIYQHTAFEPKGRLDARSGNSAVDDPNFRYSSPSASRNLTPVSRQTINEVQGRRDYSLPVQDYDMTNSSTRPNQVRSQTDNKPQGLRRVDDQQKRAPMGHSQRDPIDQQEIDRMKNKFIQQQPGDDRQLYAPIHRPPQNSRADEPRRNTDYRAVYRPPQPQGDSSYRSQQRPLEKHQMEPDLQRALENHYNQPHRSIEDEDPYSRGQRMQKKSNASQDRDRQNQDQDYRGPIQSLRPVSQDYNYNSQPKQDVQDYIYNPQPRLEPNYNQRPPKKSNYGGNNSNEAAYF